MYIYIYIYFIMMVQHIHNLFVQRLLLQVVRVTLIRMNNLIAFNSCILNVLSATRAAVFESRSAELSATGFCRI